MNRTHEEQFAAWNKLRSEQQAQVMRMQADQRRVKDLLRKIGRVGPAGREAVRYAARDYGACYRCDTIWLFVDGHSTELRRADGCYDGGMFPLCEECWIELTPLERLPFYRQLYDSWTNEKEWKGDPAWSDIERAVMAGL